MQIKYPSLPSHRVAPIARARAKFPNQALSRALSYSIVFHDMMMKLSKRPLESMVWWLAGCCDVQKVCIVYRYYGAWYSLVLCHARDYIFFLPCLIAVA